MRTIAYGGHEDTVLDLHLPTAPASEASGVTVVLVHGGFWRQRYRRDLMDPLVPSLTDAGHTVVNLEYRRVGGAGGWPTTLVDVAAGIDALATVSEVDPARVVTVGHSAGGHLAVWAASRHRLPDGTPGAAPAVRPVHAVAQAGVVVLTDAIADDLGDGAVVALLGGADSDRLAAADPAGLLPTGVPVTLVHCEGDDVVPIAQSERFVARADAVGDDANLRRHRGDHMDVIDPTHPSWADVLAAVEGVARR